MSETPIFDEMSAKILKHRKLFVADFGDWGCGWCGANGDTWDSPNSVSCTLVPYLSTTFVGVLERVLREKKFLPRSREEILIYAAKEHPLVYEKIVKVLDDANWD